MQNCLTMCNFKLDNVFLGVLGKSATQVLDALVLGDFELNGLIDRKCKESTSQIRSVLDGELNTVQVEKPWLTRQHLNDLNDLKCVMGTLIFEFATKYQPQIDLLMTVPCVSTPLTTIRIFAKIGADMSMFETTKQICSSAGLTPQN